MKSTALTRLVLFVLLTVAWSRPYAQGPLAPPGPPAPTFKTLAQVEPRTPISSLPYTITRPGSYYLTTNLICPTCTNALSGILINASHVTVDLMGFELVGVPGSSHGIGAGSDVTNVLVQNGTVRGWSVLGVALSSPYSEVRGVRALQNDGGGILVAQGVISHCLAVSNRFFAAGAGISGGRIVVRDCVALANYIGIEAGDSSLIVNNLASGNGGDGISVSAKSLVLNNVATDNGSGSPGSQGGIHATGDGNRIEGNHVYANNGDGILVNDYARKNFVIRNTAGANAGFQYRVPGIPGIGNPGDNVVGPVVTDATNVNANAWANFQQF